MQQIENKVAKSGLIQIDLEEFFPKNEVVELDLSDFLFESLILREKEFRQKLKETDWSKYRDKIVLLSLNTDAIVPSWAFILLSSHLLNFSKKVYQGNRQEFLRAYYQEIIQELTLEEYEDKRIIIKGCADKPVPETAYIELVSKLQPVAKSLMYGEACSTVPIYKKS